MTTKAIPHKEIDVLRQRVADLEKQLAEQEQTLSTLQASEERFHAVLNNLSDAPYRRNLRTDRYDYLSPVIEQLTGWTVEEMNQADLETVLNWIHPDDLPQLQQEIERTNTLCRETGRATGSLEYRFRTKAGDYRWLGDYLTVIADEDGQPLYRLGVVRDITQRKQTEKLHQQWADAFANCAHGIAIGLPSSNQILTCNSAFAQLQGRTIDEIAGMPILSIYSPADHQHVKEMIMEADRTGKARYEAHMVRKDGSVYPVQMDVVSVRDTEGILLYRVATHQDITEHKRAEETLRLSEEKYAQLFNKAVLPIALFQLPAGIFVDANEAFEETFGYSRQEIVGKTSVELGLTTPETRASILEKLQQGLLRGHEWQMRTKSGEVRIILVNSGVVTFGGQKHVITTFQDITERKRAEVEHAYLAKRVELATRSARMGIWDWDIQNNHLVWDEQMYVLYGRQPHEFAGAYEAWLQGVHLDDRAVSDVVSARARRGEGDYEAEFRVVWPDGSIHWLHASGQVFFDANGQAVRMIGVNYDITERKQTEKELRDARELFQKIFITSPIPIALSRISDRTVVDVNAAMENLLGYTRTELAGKPSTNFDYWADPQERQRAFEILLRQETLRDFEFSFKTKAGVIGQALNYTEVFHQGEEKYFLSIFVDITERKQAEDALRESERRLHEAQRMAHIGNWEWYLRTGETRWSPENYAIHGFDPDSVPLTPDTLIKCVHPDDLERVNAAISQAISAGNSADLEYRVFRPDGSMRVIHAIGAVTEFDAEGRPAIMRGTNQDITERKRAEEVLRDSEAQLNTIFEASPVAIGISRLRDGRLTHLNTAFETLYGYSRAEALGKTTAELNLWELPADRQHFVELLKAEGSGTIEATAHLKSGDKRDVLVSGRVVRINSEPSAMAQIVDITERKRTIQALRESEELFSKAFYRSPLPIVLVEISDFTIRDANDAFAEMLGITREQIIDKNAALLNVKVDPSIRSELVQELNATGMFRNKEVELQLPNGEILYLINSGAQITINNKLHNLGMFQDITARKRVEKELLETLEELKRSNAELEQFAYVASHDLQEPLRAVAGMVQLLQQQYRGRLDEEADQYIELAVEAATRMQTLINDLLTYSRVGRRGKPFKPVKAGDCLQQALRNLAVAISESRGEITFDDLPTVTADLTQLIQLFQNLIGNSLKFRGNQPPQIHISASEVEKVWQFSVRDNGIGIEPQYFERVFLVFQRLHLREEYPGTGIGLALCQKIVERHGGKIWVESQPGQGSTFYFTLPR